MLRTSTLASAILVALGCNPSQPAVTTAAPQPAPVAVPLPVAPASVTPQTAVAVPAQQFSIPAQTWVSHAERTLMPFWIMDAAKGKTANDPFPTYRCRDGLAFGQPGCDLKSGDYKVLSDANQKAHKTPRPDGTMGDGPYVWLTGPRNELLTRSYIRMHSRQTYAYGVAYHLTGKPEYLALAQRGVEWLLTHAIDKGRGSYTFIDAGKPGPEAALRTSQDQSYTLLGLAFYYYLTRDDRLLRVLVDLEEDVKKRYMSATWEGGKLMRWMLKEQMDPPACFSTIPAPDKGTTEQKELVALLDQVNAYMLLTAVSAPPGSREPWLKDLHSMASTIRDRFYNDGMKSQRQQESGVDPSVPVGMFAGCLTYKGPPPSSCSNPYCKDGKNPPPKDPENCDPANHHTDFGHSIKSFWMLYLIGREAGDLEMEKFAAAGAEALFPKAYLDNGTWARAMKKADPCTFDPKHPDFVVDRDKEWWIYAELDQMAATLSLRNPEPHVSRLNTTYPVWLSAFSPDDLEVVQWLYDSCIGNDDACPNRRIPKANLWKNSFHAMEHALVAYITTSGVQQRQAVLYYPLIKRDATLKLQPYYYHAEAQLRELGPIELNHVRYDVVEARFAKIQ